MPDKCSHFKSLLTHTVTKASLTLAKSLCLNLIPAVIRKEDNSEESIPQGSQRAQKTLTFSQENAPPRPVGPQRGGGGGVCTAWEGGDPGHCLWTHFSVTSLLLTTREVVSRIFCLFIQDSCWTRIEGKRNLGSNKKREPGSESSSQRLENLSLLPFLSTSQKLSDLIKGKNHAHLIP